jgi:hypothetical protein
LLSLQQPHPSQPPQPTILHNNSNSGTSPRASFSATRRFFQHIVLRKPNVATAASFSSLPPVIIADLQNGNIPLGKEPDNTDAFGEQGWKIVHRKRFKGKNGIGETRHPANMKSSPTATSILDEEIDPSDQVTCSVFVKWQPEEEEESDLNQSKYTMTMSPLYEVTKNDNNDERVSFFSIIKIVGIAMNNIAVIEF